MEELWELGPPPPMPAWLGAPSDRDDYTDAPQQQDDDEEGDDEDADDEAQDPLLPELPPAKIIEIHFFNFFKNLTRLSVWHRQS